jgi:hypothetical protein
MIADCTCKGHGHAETQRIVQTLRRALAIATTTKRYNANHATPGVIGDVAVRAKARRLILGHVTTPLAGDPNGARSLCVRSSDSDYERC